VQTIHLLGGYGMTGMRLARLLLEHSDVRLILSGRTLARAEQAAAELNRAFPDCRVTAVRADAADPGSLRAAFQGADLVMVTASSSSHAGIVARACLESDVDYFDIQYSREKIETLKRMVPEIEPSGRCFITDGGFHPGLPAALVRYAAGSFDRIERVVVGGLLNEEGGIPFSQSACELVSEFRQFQSLFYREGVWRKARWTSTADMLRIDFGEPFGRRLCFPMFLEEMRSLPEMYPTLRETGLFMAGFNWFTDYVVMGLIAAGVTLFPRAGVRPLSRLLCWSTRAFGKPPYGTALKLEASGIKDGQPKTLEMTLYHRSGYEFTAIPVMACLLQWLDGSARRPGLHLMAHCVEPARLLADMERMGIQNTVVDREEKR
jgi:saccharopine dehydrogenase (NAD+, L-lysine-forming)